MVENAMEKNKAGMSGSGPVCVCVCEAVADTLSEMVRKEVQDRIPGKIPSADSLGLTLTI